MVLLLMIESNKKRITTLNKNNKADRMDNHKEVQTVQCKVGRVIKCKEEVEAKVLKCKEEVEAKVVKCKEDLEDKVVKCKEDLEDKVLR